MKDLRYVTLTDIYGAALTDKQRDMLSDYYERDYSLSEIAANHGITRQGVRFCIKQAEESLDSCEEKFGTYEFLKRLNGLLDGVRSRCGDDGLTQIDELIRSKYGTVR